MSAFLSTPRADVRIRPPSRRADLADDEARAIAVTSAVLGVVEHTSSRLLGCEQGRLFGGWRVGTGSARDGGR
jgi:hypothetical protein